MALDGLLLNNIVRTIQSELPLRINRIAQISENELIFECYNHHKVNLVFSIDSISNRLSITNQPFVRVSEPNHIVMLLRKHLENGWINSLNQVGLDRIVDIMINNTNELGDAVTFKLMVELMGKYANVILVDESSKILDAFNRIPPYENTKRIIFSGAQYDYPPLADKKNPLEFQEDINLNESLVQQFHGFSPLLAREVEYRLRLGEDFNQVMLELKESPSLFIHSNLNFHAIELKHLHLDYQQVDLMEGIEQVYLESVNQQRIKQHTGNLQKIIKRELKKSKTKKEKLEVQLRQAEAYEQFREYGDLLMTYGQSIQKGQKVVEVINYDGQPVLIELDTRYNGIDNAQLYYQKYRKLKKGVGHIHHQLELVDFDIEYFDGLGHQILNADVHNAYQIRQELMDKGVLHKKKVVTKKKKKEEPIKFQSIIFDDITFNYGSTNIQNEALTFKSARKNDVWFHILDGAGSHVVAQCTIDDLNERLIRFGANLAAYHSKHRNSSSVAVGYTPVSQLKKIPRAPLGKVAMGSHHTIFIDPIDPLLMSDSLDQIGTTRDKMQENDSSQTDVPPHEQ